MCILAGYRVPNLSSDHIQFWFWLDDTPAEVGYYRLRSIDGEDVAPGAGPGLQKKVRPETKSTVIVVPAK